MPTVVVGMSGGVDSSVAALLLKQQGYHVIGLFMKNWEEEADGACTAVEDFEDASAVADVLGIPLYSVNFSQDYWENVFEPSLEAFKRGETPNPDVWCNQQIKFKVFFDKAMELGADFLATGHYCQTEDGQLLRGVDPNKDQSYFLYMVKGDVLKKVLFPLGGMCKGVIRALAADHGLVTAKKKDSTGICFIGKRDFKEFLSTFLPQKPGDFRTPEGKKVGRHDGCAFYTIGQRKGLGIGGPGEPWFVAGKDVARNIVYVVQGEGHPSLWAQELTIRDLSWVNAAPTAGQQLTAKARYRQEDQACEIVSVGEEGMRIRFRDPQKALTCGQSLVLYADDVCLGGGVIDGVFAVSGPAANCAVPAAV